MPTAYNIIILWSLWFWETAYKWNRQTCIRYYHFVYKVSINWTHHTCFAYLHTTPCATRAAFLPFFILFGRESESKTNISHFVCVFLFSFSLPNWLCTQRNVGCIAHGPHTYENLISNFRKHSNITKRLMFNGRMDVRFTDTQADKLNSKPLVAITLI